ncbi:MAG: 23S rRNA (adenine(2503)-C(2))-methyltransferase RlmN [Phycisphaeraceae bacterium]|nr:23S rRNA (adenine(2503)-C(2))-methyltransferase RlmN [Phycisphaeraceae bacterium]
MKHPPFHIFEFTPESLGVWCKDRGMQAFRGKQILEWVYERGVVDAGQMSNLSKRDREVLATEMRFLSGTVLSQQTATDGTQKLLVQWDDGSAGTPSSLPQLPSPDPARQTECVMIPATGDDGEVSRRTACISSQVGCPVGCRFCASGQGGLDGNLSAGRIVEQVWRLGRLPGVGRISNVVFMGMGEPLSNFGPVMNAVRTLASAWATGISARKITISTVGLPKAIERLAEQLELPVTLALSLHAPNDELRRRLIPWAEYSTIKELLASCQRWFEKTGREITLEYTLLRGVNDRPEHARELSRLAKSLRANINLIRYNEVPGLGLDGGEFRRPHDEDVLAFQMILRDQHVNTHIRRSRGRDIAAACGQLRHEAAEREKRPA